MWYCVADEFLASILKYEALQHKMMHYEDLGWNWKKNPKNRRSVGKFVGPWDVELIFWVRFQTLPRIDILSNSSEIGLVWVQQNNLDELWTLVEIITIDLELYRHMASLGQTS